MSDWPKGADEFGQALSDVQRSARKGDIAQLMRALDSELEEGDLTIRGEAIRHLGRLGVEDAVRGAIGLLSDTKASVRLLAAGALGRIRDPTSLGSLVQASYDPVAEVRMAAAGALGEIRDRNAIGRLIELLDDPSSKVRLSAAEALGKLGDSAALSSLNAARARESILRRRYFTRAVRAIQRVAS